MIAVKENDGFHEKDVEMGVRCRSMNFEIGTPGILIFLHIFRFFFGFDEAVDATSGREPSHLPCMAILSSLETS